MPENKLADNCIINTNIGESVFVGVKRENGDVRVSFPLGFYLEKDNDKQLRRDVLLLLNVLAKNTTHKKSELMSQNKEIMSDFPIRAYLSIISDFFTRGYYKEKETTFQISQKGKINWERTIKTQRAYIQDQDVFYLDYVTRKNNIKENELITLIHEYCVYESFEKIGWLFTMTLPQRPRIRLNKRIFISTINNKLSATFNDKNRNLFNDMLAVISAADSIGDNPNYTFGTDRFEYVWEKMVDRAFGESNKIDYFPRTKWHLSSGKYNNSYLEPDTIMLANESIYVLDSKYYKYGNTNNPSDLPDSSSIGKQITYGEYIQENIVSPDGSKTVYNAFIMPFNSERNDFNTNKKFHYIGSATSDWKANDGLKPYEKVAGILLDVKSLMQNYSKDYGRILELAQLIEEQV